MDDWLPERHLARFVVEVIDGLDLSAMSRSYRGTGSASYHPALLLGILVYGYATGVFSSRKLERATYDSVAFRFIAANDHPDHDTIATFRRRFLKEIDGLFVQVLALAREIGMLKLGTVALDGTKIHANASRHSALSYEHAGKIEAQLKAEVAELLARAEAADHADVPDGMSIPDELARREQRLAKLAQARAKIEARAKERFEREAAEHKAKLAAREAKAKATGNKPTGKPPQPPVEGARPTDQINLTDEASRIMPFVAGGHRLLQRSQRGPLRCGADRSDDCAGPPVALSALVGALCQSTVGAREPDAARSHEPSSADARRQEALCLAQADPGAGVRDHQIGDGLPPVPAAWARKCPR